MKKTILAIIIAMTGVLILINGTFEDTKGNMPVEQIEQPNTTETTTTSTITPKTTKVAKKTTKTPNKPKQQKIEYFNIQASKSEMQEYARQYISNNEEYEAFDFIITRESGWNTNAVNKKSGASGLCQSLPASKMASAGNDYKTNYKTQVHWCVSYCKTRYGSIQNAKQFWLKHHWF